jgi:hypothetical protein
VSEAATSSLIVLTRRLSIQTVSITRHSDRRPPAGVNLTVTACFFGLFWFYAARGRRLIVEDADPRLISGISRSYIPGAPIYGIATLVALVSPTVSVALFGLIALFYVLESSIFGGTPVAD